MLLKNCKILKNGKFEKVDILIKDNKIEKISENIDIADENTIDVKNRFVTAGFIDAHVHWREPGFSKKETVYTASRAAARGGFTTVMTMPNLNPVPDSVETLNKQLEKLRAKEVIFQKFEQSLNEKYNHMSNSGEEQEYYGKVEYYLSQLNSESYNNGTQYSKIQDEYTKLNKITAERDQLDADLQALQNELLQLQQQGDSSPLSDTKSADDKAKLETKISEITTKIEALKTNITSKNSEIDTQQSNIKDMNRTYNNPTSQAYNIYAQLISELGTARSNNNKNITELEANLGVATGQDKAHSILAPNEGTLHYIVPLKQGMSIQQGQTIAEVSGKEKGYYVEAFVLASDISRVSEGAKADVAITGVNSQKYGTLKGQVRQIDSGTISQETKEGNISLYKVIIELETLTLKHGSETVVLQKDMPVEVRIVYDKETYLDWILEMLSFKQ